MGRICYICGSEFKLIFVFYATMNENELNIEYLIKYWVDSSDDDFETMKAMYDSKRYNWSLFIGHLLIEKLLKAYFVKVKNDYPPYIHNLLRLAEKTDVLLTDDKIEQLVTITAFNINARYDDYKSSFKNQCTIEFTDYWVEKIKELRTWLKTLIMQ